MFIWIYVSSKPKPMKIDILKLIDFEKVDTLLEGFNKTTGFVTAILDLEGNILSKSGWRTICTEFHRVNPCTSQKCTISDTVLANELATGEKYHFYECLNGMVDVAVPVIVNGEHIANLFSGQFFFNEPNHDFFKNQAASHRFDEVEYMKVLEDVPVVSLEKVKVALDFLLNMTQLISEMTFQKLEQIELNNAIRKNEQIFRLFIEHSPASIAMFDNQMRYLVTSRRFLTDYNLGDRQIIGRSHYEVFPEISESWKDVHRRCLAGETINADSDPFPRADGTTDWVRWEIRPWYEAENQIGGIILLSEVITDRVKTHEELIESERHLRNSQKIAHVGSWQLDLETNQVMWTEELYKMYDFDPSLPPPPYTEHMKLFTPESWEKLSASLAMTRDNGTPYELELETVKKDGSHGWMWVRGEALRDPAGNINALWGAAQDITDRKQTQVELERLLASEQAALKEANKAKENLSQILERISDGFGSLDSNWCYTFVNDKLAESVGRRREEMLGQNIWKVFPEAVGTQVYQAYQRAMTEQMALDLEHYYPPFDRWFHHRFYPSKEGISVFSHDITERKQAKEKLIESEDRFRKIFEEGPLGMVMANMTTGKFLSVNKAFCDMLGYAPEELSKFTFMDVTHPDDRANDLIGIKKLQEDQIQRYNTVKRYRKKSGEIIWANLSVTKIYSNKEQFHYALGMIEDITERRQAEEKVRLKDIQFRKLSKHVSDLIFQFTRRPDGSYCVPIASEGIWNIFGCSPEDVLEDFSPIARVIYPEDAERVIADIEYSAKHLTYFTCEFRVQIPGREIQWIYSKSTPEKMADGSITWYGFNADITDRKRTDDLLKKSEARFKLLFENATFGMVICKLIRDESGKAIDYLHVQANESLYRHVGIFKKDVLGKLGSEVISKEETAFLVEKFNTVIATGVPSEYQQYLPTFDKTIDMQCIYIEEDYFSVLFFDVTEKEKSQEKIKTLNERLRLLLEAIQNLSTSISLENVMETVRVYARRLLNAEGSTFILRDSDFCYYADEDTISPLWKGQRFPISQCISGWVMLNKQSVIINDIYTDARIPIESYRSTFVHSLAMAPIRLNDPLGAIGVYWGVEHAPSPDEVQLLQTLADATAKAVENIQLIEDLEVRIDNRTSQLKAANKEMEAFSYSVSHDLRAPLRHINGYVDLLNDRYRDVLPDKARHYLTTITDASRQMGTLIDDLLQFSRTGRQELRKVKLDMNVLVNEALEKIQPDTVNRQITWTVHELPWIFGDYSLLKQVWINLLDNAVKYSRSAKSAEITIECRDEKECFVFLVRDNGVGFDMKYAHKLFGVFQRLHSQNEFEGTGIGLANVQRIVNKHNGRVWAEAEPNKGATFYFSIPKKMEESHD